jgi:hypothetical protein
MKVPGCTRILGTVRNDFRRLAAHKILAAPEVREAAQAAVRAVRIPALGLA